MKKNDRRWTVFSNVHEKVVKGVDAFHVHYEKERIWDNNSWLGVPCWKLPFDAFIIQELIVKTRPSIIIETGTGKGGSAVFYASILELMNIQGDIITIDVEDKVDKDLLLDYHWADSRINFLIGSSLGRSVFNEVEFMVGIEKDVMVILDSWHTEEHVLKEMMVYSRFVPVGGYMIIEDSHADGNPVPWEWKDKGPMGAIRKWMESKSDEWEIDKECHKHLMTFNPCGYLRRIK